MTKRNRQPKQLPTAAAGRVSGEGPSEHRFEPHRFEPRPFRRRPWLLAASALTLAAWLAFLGVMAWQPWEAKKRPPPLREKEAAQRATGE